ncbi:MAG TPA: Crp/Fnr family transcriptional regulator [Verrucomicrobiae bacterium]|jgi:CRP-like cAMP-binding protein
MNIAEQLLRHSTLFQGANDAIMAALLERAATVHFAASEVPIAESTVTDQILMIVEGELRLEVALQDVDRDVKLLRAGPGTFLGLVNFFGIAAQPCSAIALTHVTALTWKAEEWRQLCEANPAFGYQLSQRIGHELVERMSHWINNLLNTVSWVM